MILALLRMQSWEVDAGESIRDLTTRYNSSGDTGRFAEVHALFHDDPECTLRARLHRYLVSHDHLHRHPGRAPLRARAAARPTFHWTDTRSPCRVWTTRQVGCTSSWPQRSVPITGARTWTGTAVVRTSAGVSHGAASGWRGGPPARCSGPDRALRELIDLYPSNSAAIRARMIADKVSTALSLVEGRPATCW